MTARPSVLSSNSLCGDTVVNPKGEKLGSIEELMIDLSEGRVAYAVVSFGGFLGVGDKLFAVPWQALKVDTKNKQLILDESKERLEKAPGFDKSEWPDMADRRFGSQVHDYYGTPTYW